MCVMFLVQILQIELLGDQPLPLRYSLPQYLGGPVSGCCETPLVGVGCSWGVSLGEGMPRKRWSLLLVFLRKIVCYVGLDRTRGLLW